MDQYPGLRGIWAPFFGRLAATTTLPALLSLRTGAPVMFVGMTPDGEGKWKITFHDPIYPPTDKEEKAEFTRTVTACLNEKLALTVRDNPEEWFWVHNRFKLSGTNLFPFQRKIETALPPGMTMEETSRFQILVRSPNPLGDACMSIPAVRAIKHGRPDARVTILCRSNLSPLWKQQPEVDDIIEIEGKSTPKEVGKLIRERRSHYDVAFLFPNSLRSAREAKAGGIPFIFGYIGHHRTRILKWAMPEPPADPPMHHLERYLHLLEWFGADIDDREKLLALPSPPSPIVEGQKEWKICLCPGAEFGEAKRWPLDRFAETVKKLRAELPDHSMEFSIVGSPGEASLGDELAEQLDGAVSNLAGKTTVGELIEHLKTCHLVLSNDTGTMHLAAALGIPTVALFGSTDPGLTRPDWRYSQSDLGKRRLQSVF